MRAIASGAVLFLTSCALLAQPASLVLLRHAEKPLEESDPHLSSAGAVRAEWLATWLATASDVAGDGPPEVLVAARSTPHGHGLRTRETLEPTSRRLSIPIHTPQASKDYAALARWLLTSRECRGKRVVVCWTHEFLPQLAAALGRAPQPAPWHGGDFDRVWRVRWEAGRPRWEEFHQPLRFEKTSQDSRPAHRKK
jgi:hypothetical protein